MIDCSKVKKMHMLDASAETSPSSPHLPSPCEPIQGSTPTIDRQPQDIIAPTR